MFEIIGDEIIYQNKTIARFEPKLAPSFRNHVEIVLTQEVLTEDEIEDKIAIAEENTERKIKNKIIKYIEGL